MTFQQELNSWFSPSSKTTSPAPTLGSKAPSSEKLPFPPQNGKPTIVAFLRHCGCPFAEKTLLTLRTLSTSHSSLNFLAISHSSPSSTENWLSSIPGGSGSVSIIVDEEREIYAKWGLGISSAWHVLNPWSFWELYKLGNKEGIWNRPTESGYRWQLAGSWGVDEEGVVRWGGVSRSADEIGDFGEGVRILEEGGKK